MSVDKFAQRMRKYRERWQVQKARTLDGVINREPVKTSSPLRNKPTKRISFCIPCMGRLHHLRQTLPQSIDNTSTFASRQFVILDYNSRDGLHDWINGACGEHVRSGLIKYVRLDWPRYFHMSHAKNVAHIAADGEILMHVDADYFLGEGICELLDGHFRRDRNIVVRFGDAGGRLAVHRNAFLAVRGYDETFVGWGHEDWDFLGRLKQHGLREMKIRERRYRRHVCHGDEERMSNMACKDKEASNIGNEGIRKANEWSGRTVVNPQGFGEESVYARNGRTGHKCVVIFGFYRSGTSMLAHLLSENDIFFGKKEDLKSADRYNPNGYFEHKDLLALNRAILKQFGMTWTSTGHLPTDFVDKLSRSIHQKISMLVAKMNRNDVWGLKDPSICRTYLAWKRHFDAQGVNVVKIAIKRNATNATKSMRKWGIKNAAKLYEVYWNDAAKFLGDDMILQFASLIRGETNGIEALLSAHGIAVNHLRDAARIIDPDIPKNGLF